MEIDELEQLLELLYGLDCAYVLDEKEEAAQNLLIEKVESIYEDEKKLRSVRPTRMSAARRANDEIQSRR